MSLGAFVQGLQGVVKSVSDLRKARQEEEIRDILIRGAMDEEGARGTLMEDQGMSPWEGGLRNPWVEKFLGSFGKSKRHRLPKGEVTVTDLPMEGTELDPYNSYSTLDYRDGGKVKRRAIPMADGDLVGPRTRWQQNREQQLSEYEKQRATDAEAREAIREDAKATRGEKVEGPKRTPTRGETVRDAVLNRNVPEGAGRSRRWLNSAVGKTGAALALADTARRGFGTPTEDYYERFGFDRDGPEFSDSTGGRLLAAASDVGIRGLGAASDLGSVLTFGAADALYRDKRRQAIPAPASQPAAPAPAAAPATPAATGGAATGQAAGAPRQALPADKPLPENPDIELEDVDFSGMDQADVPDYKARDWVDFREKALNDLIARGVPLSAAAEQVDAQVTTMQQRAFVNFAMQGLALQEAGDVRGAQAAFRGAFQMFPSGTDVKFGVHNGKIVGVGIDEETGEPVGTPMVIDSERVAAIIDNFRQPGAWQQWAKDRRDFQLTLKKYMEMEKPLAEAQGSAMLTTANAAATRANADMLAAQTGGALSGSTSNAGFRNAEATYRKRLEMLQMTNPQEADRLAAQMSEMKRRNPDAPDNMIIMFVMDRAGYGVPQE